MIRNSKKSFLVKSWNRLVLLTLVVLCSCNNEKDAIYPEFRPLKESVYTSVTIQPDSLYQAHAIVSGILDKNLVEEGTIVNEGEAIIQVINNSPKLNAQNAELQLKLAQDQYNGRAAILKTIEDEIKAATLKYKNDSVNYFRQKNLWLKKIGSKAEYDSKELNYQLAKNNLQLLKSRYESTKNELETAVKQAANNLETAKIASDDYTVISRVSGKVYALYKEPGEIVSTMEPLATIGSRDRFIVEMLVDEVDIVKVEPQQKVLIVLDAYGERVFEGKVFRILPKKDERNQTFTVEALFDIQPKTLYPGLAGEANIIIKEKDSVLTLPISYLKDNSVETKDGTITIEIGLRNMEFVEVISGIDANTEVFKPKN